MIDLNENEKEALRILWDSGEAKPASVQDAFGWEIENATLRSVLVNLVEKGLVTRRRVGKAYLYRARGRRSTLFSQTMQRMAEIFTSGSMTDLILELMKREKLSPEDLATLKEISERQQPDSEKPEENK